MTPPLDFSWSISPLLLKGKSRTMRLCGVLCRGREEGMEGEGRKKKGEGEKEGGGIDRRRMKRIEMNEDERDMLKLARDNEEGGL
jgi:hypothetical protein